MNLFSCPYAKINEDIKMYIVNKATKGSSVDIYIVLYVACSFFLLITKKVETLDRQNVVGCSMSAMTGSVVAEKAKWQRQR